MNFSIKAYKNRNIRIDPQTRCTCLTDMAAASGKRFYDWHRLDGSIQFLQALSELTGIPVNDLITTSGNTVANKDRGTWGHPQVAIEFAGWCSPQFKVQVTKWIDDLLTKGSVDLVEKRPGLLDDNFFDLSSVFEMKIWNKLVDKLEEDEDLDIALLYCPDNGKGFATVEAIDRGNNFLEYTTFVSISNAVHRRIMHESIDVTSKRDISVVYCLDKERNLLSKFPMFVEKTKSIC